MFPKYKESNKQTDSNKQTESDHTAEDHTDGDHKCEMMWSVVREPTYLQSISNICSTLCINILCSNVHPSKIKQWSSWRYYVK